MFHPCIFHAQFSRPGKVDDSYSEIELFYSFVAFNSVLHDLTYSKMTNVDNEEGSVALCRCKDLDVDRHKQGRGYRGIPLGGISQTRLR